MFRAHVLIVRSAKLYYTVSGIITPVGGRPVHRLREGWMECIELWVLLHSRITSSLLGRNIFLSTLFSNALSLCFTLNVRDQLDPILSARNAAYTSEVLFVCHVIVGN